MGWVYLPLLSAPRAGRYPISPCRLDTYTYLAPAPTPARRAGSPLESHVPHAHMSFYYRDREVSSGVGVYGVALDPNGPEMTTSGDQQGDQPRPPDLYYWPLTLVNII